MGACQKAIQILPENYQAYNTLGNIYKEFGRFDEAAKLPEKVIQEDEKLLMYYDVATMRLGGDDGSG